MADSEYMKKNCSKGASAQAILDAGLNVFALQLLVESYTHHPNPIPVSFRFKGVTISLAIDNTDSAT